MGRQPRLMHRFSPAEVRGLLLVTLLSALVAGCSSGASTEMTKEDKDNFKGGPMPANFTSQPGAAPANGPPK